MLLLAPLAACASPPQVLEISPVRGANDVRSNQPISIRFDRPMDRASVARNFHLEPGVRGSIRWPNDREMVFDHAPLEPSSKYQAILEPGYRDARGNVDSLRHSWHFSTEAPPALTGTNPGAGETGVDPAAYLSLTFSRPMELGSLSSALSVSPSVRVSLHRDPADPRRVIVAPAALLQADVQYSIAVTSDARDVDGNHLPTGVAVTFHTGALHSLHHWIGFVAKADASSEGEGIWIVDENRIPRQLVATPVQSYVWSPDGSRVLLRGPQGGWSDRPLDGTVAEFLPIKGNWAGYLERGFGYAYTDQGELSIYRPGGGVQQVASGVGVAAVAPGGRRIAFTVAGAAGGWTLMAYDAGLRTMYRLQSEPGRIDGLSWSPDGLSLAYRVSGAEAALTQIRVRLLQGADAAVTVARGDFSAPAWQADSHHLIVAGPAETAGPIARAYRLAVAEPARAPLPASAGLPTSAAGVSVSQPVPSPDGHQIAFLSAVAGRPQIWLMNADGTGVSQLTHHDGTDFPYSCAEAAWTPS